MFGVRSEASRARRPTAACARCRSNVVRSRPSLRFGRAETHLVFPEHAIKLLDGYPAADHGECLRADEVAWVGVELPAACFFAHDHVLDSDPEAAGDDDRRLVGEGHAYLERRVVLGRDEWPLVDVEPDAVAHAVAEVLAEARLLDRLAAGGVHLRGGDAAPRSRAAGLLRLEHDLVGVAVLVRRI